MSCIYFRHTHLLRLGRPFIGPSQALRSDLWLPRCGPFRMGLLQTFPVAWARYTPGPVQKLATIATMTSINTEVGSQVDDSCLVAQNLIFHRLVSMAIQTVVELGIADILAGAEGRKPLSAEEILRQLPTKSTPGPTSVRNLQRLLSPLVKEGLFSESLDGDEPVYGLTKVSQWFVRENPLSLAPFADFILCPAFAACDCCLPEAILDETTTSFIQAHGVPIFEFHEPEFGITFQKAMDSNSNVFLKGAFDSTLLSGVLDGVTTLVDVGGSRGRFVSQIVANNPHVQGINFDLPTVIATVPAVNGVQHIAGNFFESIPSGDAMFLKLIVHSHGDEDVIQILKNCYKALPEKNGKVILVEHIKDTDDDDRIHAAFVDKMDLAMLAYSKGARERNMEEYQALLAVAGFPLCKVTRMPDGLSVIEGFKE